MAGFDPNQPRDDEGKWTEADRAARKAAGLDAYKVPEIPDATIIDLSGKDWVKSEDNRGKPPIKIDQLRQIKHASEEDKEFMRQIARDEKEFYDNPNSLGPDEHTEVQLLKKKNGIFMVRYVEFDTKTKNIIHEFFNDFSRCPACKHPTLTPFEEEYPMCSTCLIPYVWRE